eukprot:Hpha_TRINITY_DN16661_c1_g1::TRINITY_DN16661_c1_g1_i6::g.180482::m.180482
MSPLSSAKNESANKPQYFSSKRPYPIVQSTRESGPGPAVIPAVTQKIKAQACVSIDISPSAPQNGFERSGTVVLLSYTIPLQKSERRDEMFVNGVYATRAIATGERGTRR